MVREYTVMGFCYTSETGFKELDNPALKLYAESPECPHKRRSGTPASFADKLLKSKPWPRKSTM